MELDVEAIYDAKRALKRSPTEVATGHSRKPNHFGDFLWVAVKQIAGTDKARVPSYSRTTRKIALVRDLLKSNE